MSLGNNLSAFGFGDVFCWDFGRVLQYLVGEVDTSVKVLVVIREQSLEELLEDLKSLQRHSKEERISKKLYKENKKIESSISEATLLKMIHEEIEAAL